MYDMIKAGFQALNNSEAVDEQLLRIREAVALKMNQLSISLSFDEILAYEKFLKEYIIAKPAEVVTKYMDDCRAISNQSTWASFWDNRYKNFYQLNEREFYQQLKQVTTVLLQKIASESGANARVIVAGQLVSVTLCLERIQATANFERVSDKKEGIALLGANALTSELWSNIPSIKAIQPHLPTAMRGHIINPSTIQLRFLEDNRANTNLVSTRSNR